MDYMTVREVSRGSSAEIAKHLEKGGVISMMKQGKKRFESEPINPTAGMMISEFKQNACSVLKKLESVGQSIIVTQHTSRSGEYIRSWRITLVEVD